MPAWFAGSVRNGTQLTGLTFGAFESASKEIWCKAMKNPCEEGMAIGRQAASQSPLHGSWILLTTILGSSMAFIDGTVVTVALPVLQGEALRY
jgi:hypothetical protein